MKDNKHFYLVEDQNGCQYDPPYATREQARNAKRMLDEAFGVKHKIVRYVREEIVR